MKYIILQSIFIGGFLVSSLITYFVDIKTDKQRINNKNINKLILKNTYKKIMPLTLFNLLCTNSLMLYLTMPFFNIYNRNFTIINFIIDAGLVYLLMDIFLYCLHRLFHCKYLYKFHKIHHELTDPIGPGALYAHPIDYIFGISLPLILPFIVISANMYSVYIISFISITTSVLFSHSGYNIFNNNLHNIHHTKFKYNYGISVFMDRLFNTYKS